MLHLETWMGMWTCYCYHGRITLSGLIKMSKEKRAVNNLPLSFDD